MFLETLTQVTGVESIKGEAGGLHIFCEDAATEIPSLLAALKAQLDITPKIVEPYVPAFDEVFVRLIQAVEKNQHQELAQ